MLNNHLVSNWIVESCQLQRFTSGRSNTVINRYTFYNSCVKLPKSNLQIHLMYNQWPLIWYKISRLCVPPLWRKVAAQWRPFVNMDLKTHNALIKGDFWNPNKTVESRSLHGTQREDAKGPKNEENVPIFSSAGFVQLFYQFLCSTEVLSDSYLSAATLVCSLSTLPPPANLLHDVTHSDCPAQNGQAHGYIFTTSTHWLTNETIN